MNANHWEKLIQNGEKYLEQNWKSMSKRERINTIEDTIQLLRTITSSNKIHVRFDKDVLEFDPLTRKEAKPHLKCIPMGDTNTRGFFDSKSNRLCVNLGMVLGNDGKRVFETVIHEFTHKTSWELSRHMSDYPTDSKNYKCLKVLNRNSQSSTDIFAFGINCGKRLYVDNMHIINNSELNSKMSMFYMLISTERHANSFAQSLCQQLFEKYNPQQYTNAIQDFKSMYHCSHLSNSQIFAILDRVQDCLIDGSRPINAIDAIVAYDLATAVAFCNGTIDEQEYTIMQKEDARTRAIEDVGYQIPWKKQGTDIRDLEQMEEYVCNLEYLNGLSSEEQLNNPELIFQIAFVEWGETLRVIKDVDALKKWYYSEANTIPIGVQYDLGVYLGGDFSPKVREQKMRECGLDVSSNVNISLCDWPRQLPVGSEIDFSDPKHEDIDNGLIIER